jgi:hypothetical protein
MSTRIHLAETQRNRLKKAAVKFNLPAPTLAKLAIELACDEWTLAAPASPDALRALSPTALSQNNNSALAPVLPAATCA